MVFQSIGSATGALAATTLYATAGWGTVCVLGAAFSCLGLLLWVFTRHGGPAPEHSATVTSRSEVRALSPNVDRRWGAPQVSQLLALLAFHGCALFTVPRDNDRPAPIGGHPLLVPVGRGRPEGTANMTGQQDRWAELTGGQAGEEYAQRFARLVQSGHDVHGEAAFCNALLRPDARVLDAGCGTGRIAIRLAELGHRCTGVDVDSSMLAVARRDAPELDWLLGDLARLDALGLEPDFDLALAAGNVVPLLAPGSESAVIRQLAAALKPGGLLVTGMGLDAAHLPLPEPPLTLADFDDWCTRAGLVLRQRYATWSGDPYQDGCGYAVSVHSRPA